MTRPASHDEAWPELPAAALDALPAAERAAVLAHAADCPQCAPELAAQAAAAALVGRAAPAASMDAERSARLRARLLARAAADAGGTARAAPAAPVAAAPIAAVRARPARGLAPWLAVAASIAFLVAAVGLARVSRERDALRVAAAGLQRQRVATAAVAESLGGALVEKERMLRALTGPAVRVVDLTATGTREPTARMFWDRATNRWTMFAHNLAAPKAGKTYQLWLVTADDRRISAGTFAPDSAGAVMMQATYPLAPTALRAIAVTEEPMGGRPQPTGPIVIAGQLRG
jgi:anti-sigma-K factor RskA